MNIIELPLEFDVHKLQQDLKAAENYWKVSTYTTLTRDEVYPQWKMIGLRTQGGDPGELRPSNPGLFTFQNTIVLDKTPYFRDVLSLIKTELHSVRLSSLEPGTSISEHCDTFHGFNFGQIRLHIPIITDPEVVFIIGGEKKHLTAGKLWYGDFSLPHTIHNKSKIRRVHMILDVRVNKNILKLFPQEFINSIGKENILFSKKPYSMDTQNLRDYECDFVIHPGLITGIFDSDDTISGRDQHASIRLVDNKLLVSLKDEAILALYPVSKTEFYFNGYHAESSIKFQMHNNRVKKLFFVMRQGSSVTKIQLPLINKS